jgi:drug/metabolite transporter (DMT)-like permease
MSLLSHPSNRVATSVLLFSATLWGLSWMPLKWFIEQRLTGPIVSLLSYGLVGLFSCVFIWRQRAAWRAQWGLLLALALVGGWANTSFVNAIMLGDVVRVMFLFYLSPVWSVLGGWLFLKERIPPLRWAAVVVALVGLWLFLGGPGGIDMSFSFVDFLALSAGFCFAANNVIARAAQQVPMVSKTFAVFVGCGVISLIATTSLGHRVPENMGAGLWLAVLAYGFVWLLLATATWQFGVTHIESSKAGVILLIELVVAVLTALWFGDETMTGMEWAGGALIAMAALGEAIDLSTASKTQA